MKGMGADIIVHGEVRRQRCTADAGRERVSHIHSANER
jgi:hypothetical protein